MSVVWHVIHKRSLHLREPNEVRILRLVRDREALSRIELARATGLHKATVTDLAAKLIRAGYLEDTGEVETRKRVGGKLAQACPNVAEMIQVRIHGDVLTPPAEAVRICRAANRENGVVLGAAGLVLNELFEPLPAGRVRAVRRTAGVTPAEPVLN